MKHVALIFLLLLYSTIAVSELEQNPRISLIIDDLGYRMAAGRRVINLPGPVVVSILPGTPHAVSVAQLANSAGKEIIAHLPMQSIDDRNLGPMALTAEMDKVLFIEQIEHCLNAIPFIQGVNNHMGSLLTRSEHSMAWLMEKLAKRGGLFFVDSRTTHHTVAQEMASNFGLPNLKRDVFLDNDPVEDNIRAEFERLISIARRRGYAIAIGHPNPATLRFLENRLPLLKSEGIDLVSLSTILRAQQSIALN